MRDLSEEAISIFLKTASSLNPSTVIRNRLVVEGEFLFVDQERVRLSDFSDVRLIGIGKASVTMASVIEEMFGGRITSGIIVTNSRPRVKLNSEVIVGGHPLPDANSLIAGDRIINALRTADEQSLIIFLISGGGSALAESPLFDEITLEDIQDLNRILVNCGASIQEINVIRKHLSKIKGGRLGYLVRNSMRVALYISDVNRGDMRSIASNPLLRDDVTLEDFSRIVAEYGLAEKLPRSIASLIEKDQVPPLPDWNEDEAGGQVNLMLIENADALRVAAETARELGFEVSIESASVEGDYKKVAGKLISELAGLQKARGKKVCLISGGEVSCPVSGRGVGGRNQEFTLYAASRLAASGIENAVVLSCGTDGVDGNSIATGAVLSASAMGVAEERNLDLNRYFETSDSHSFFLEYGGLVVTGPTGNNIRDLRILLAR